ncbi:DUF1003 domain-containing protein [Edaphosphingomonas haloaromaticamans]|uniref:DUF1003 domain-containing protein n=1 Tax=Edaphosphingomonas haloaromaticamans TaxID=653954 RepID=A0A1S1HIP4_9SPHN|nr:DUF1003 domain-containing protein [Sphingomonas haloaromaticamans]OHT22115.1 hypothetical protein BHE75_04137 [Sphingomonas haloaromaticamans]
MNNAIRFFAFHLRRARPQRDPNELVNEGLTFGGQLADRVAAVGGSWGFIIGFCLFLAGWAAINTVVLVAHAFDPFPFIFLNLMLSMLAALQAPIIMMSQNRQAAKDRLEARLDYETNQRAEAQIALLYEEVLAVKGQLRLLSERAVERA